MRFWLCLAIPPFSDHADHADLQTFEEAWDTWACSEDFFPFFFLLGYPEAWDTLACSEDFFPFFFAWLSPLFRPEPTAGAKGFLDFVFYLVSLPYSLQMSIHSIHSIHSISEKRENHEKPKTES